MGIVFVETDLTGGHQYNHARYIKVLNQSRRTSHLEVGARYESAVDVEHKCAVIYTY